MEYKIINTGVMDLLFVHLAFAFDEPFAMSEEVKAIAADLFRKYENVDLGVHRTETYARLNRIKGCNKILFRLGEEKESDITPLLKKDEHSDVLYLKPNSAVNMGGSGKLGLVRTEYYQAMTCWELFLNDNEIRILEPPPLNPPPVDQDAQVMGYYNEYKASHEKSIARYTKLKHLNEKHWIVLEVSEGAGPAAPDSGAPDQDNSPKNSKD